MPCNASNVGTAAPEPRPVATDRKRFRGFPEPKAARRDVEPCRRDALAPRRGAAARRSTPSDYPTRRGLRRRRRDSAGRPAHRRRRRTSFGSVERRRRPVALQCRLLPGEPSERSFGRGSANDLLRVRSVVLKGATCDGSVRTVEHVRGRAVATRVGGVEQEVDFAFHFA